MDQPAPAFGAAPAVAGQAAMLEPWAHLTLAGLSRIASRTRPHTLAIGEAPDTAEWYHRTPRVLSYAELHASALHFARQMAALGLLPGDKLLISLPNVADLAIAIVGAAIAGLVPCPLPVSAGPLALRQAAELMQARALVTGERVGDTPTALAAREVAAAVFGLRHVCGFGADLPDGVVALDAWNDVEETHGQVVDSAGDVALVTFETYGPQLRAIARTHNQLIADALALSAVGRMSRGASVVSTIPAATALGVVAAVALPLLTGASVHLHGPFSSQILRDQLSFRAGAHLIVPEALEPVLEQVESLLPHKMGTPLLVQRWPALAPPADRLPAQRRVVDLHAVGETAIVATARQAGERRRPLAARVVHPAPLTLAQGIPLTEFSLADGAVLARGFGVGTPTDAGDGNWRDWRETGFFGVQDGREGLSIVVETAGDITAGKAA